MLRWRLAALLCCTIFAWLVCVPESARAAQDPIVADEAAYRAALEAARGWTREQSWKKAQNAWLELIQAHAGAAYVCPELEEIRLQLRRASFWASTRAPKLGELLSGNLLSYEPGTGSLKILYTHESLGDFTRGRSAESGTFAHPAHFKGPWTITLDGTPAEVSHPACLISDGASGHGVRFGFREPEALSYVMHVLFEYGENTNKDVAKCEPKLRKSKSAEVEAEIHVDMHSIRAWYDGVQVLECARESADFGSFILSATAKFGQLTLAGKVDQGWLDGVMDSAVVDKRHAFDATWKDPPEFARWKSVDLESRKEPRLEELLGDFKVELSSKPGLKEFYDKLTASIATDRTQTLSALAELAKPREEPLPVEVCAYLQFKASLRLGRYADALGYIATLKPAEGHELDVALMHAVLLGSAGRGQESAAELEVLAREHPLIAAVHIKLVDTLLRLAKPAQAREAMQRALAALPSSAALKELEIKVVKADLGPPWKKLYEYEGQYFAVRSETSLKLCRDTVRVLDKAMQRCVFEFGALPESRPARSIAYLFSGESSYREYVKGIADDSLEHSLGVYSLVLKQIVAWNQPDPERLWDTLRHECLHCYVDLRAGEVARWFGEGLAETLAASAQRDETWKDGNPRPNWIALLLAENVAFPALEEFANQSDAQFLAHVERNYALSWAWIHYLRFGNAEGRAVFAALWAALLAGKDDSVAIDLALAGHDAHALHANFIAYLNKLLHP